MAPIKTTTIQPLAVNRKEAARLIGIHYVHYLRLEKRGFVPKGIRLGDAERGRIIVSVAEITKWLERRVAEQAA